MCFTQDWIPKDFGENPKREALPPLLSKVFATTAEHSEMFFSIKMFLNQSTPEIFLIPGAFQSMFRQHLSWIF